MESVRASQEASHHKILNLVLNDRNQILIRTCKTRFCMRRVRIRQGVVCQCGTVSGHVGSDPEVDLTGLTPQTRQAQRPFCLIFALVCSHCWCKDLYSYNAGDNLLSCDEHYCSMRSRDGPRGCGGTATIWGQFKNSFLRACDTKQRSLFGSGSGSGGGLWLSGTATETTLVF